MPPSLGLPLSIAPVVVMMMMVMAPPVAVMMVVVMSPPVAVMVMMIARKLDPALGAFRHRAGIVGLERSDRIGNRL